MTHDIHCSKDTHRTMRVSCESKVDFSKQPIQRGSVTSVQHRWMLVDDFFNSMSHHRHSRITLRELICVHESTSRCYCQSGHWIEHGLLMHVATDRKPETSCEKQPSTYGRIGEDKRHMGQRALLCDSSAPAPYSRSLLLRMHPTNKYKIAVARDNLWVKRSL